LKIAVLGDVHLIADHDPYKQLHRRRDFFKSGWPSFQHLLKMVNDESPDLTILLGDLVDWFSPENIAFGLDLLTDLHGPWFMTPGNHDIAAPADGFDQADYRTVATRDHLTYWTQQGVTLAHRVLDVEGLNLVLLDSSLSHVVDGTEDWLARAFKPGMGNFLFTHVPIDLPQTRDYILSIDSRRSMVKYVLSGAPNLYADQIKDRFSHVFSGHLHFPGDLTCDTTRFHLCNMSISMNDPNRSQNAVASAILIEKDGSAFSLRKIEAEE
jgi:3',5'-cyclic AMP phosphodiesterase CpdA